MQLPRDEVTDILNRLGLNAAQEADGWRVTAPPYRFDIAIEEDLIEEVARIYGYDRLPSVSPTGALRMGAAPEGRLEADRLRGLLVARGYQEAITYSFVAPELQQLLDPEAAPLALANPISAEMAVMRTTLWSGLVQALLNNVNRQQERVHLFETGLRFVPEAAGLRQERTVAGLVYGAVAPEQWGEALRKADFFDAKGDVEELLALAGAADNTRIVAAGHPALHPGQSARVEQGGEIVGWLGALHPSVAEKLGLPTGVYLFELSLSVLEQGCIPRFRELSKFPVIRRDIAVVVDQSLPVERIMEIARGAAPEELRELKLFDLYMGKGIDSGRKSVALGLTLQANSRTLTDHEVDAAMAKIVAVLGDEFGATLRD